MTIQSLTRQSSVSAILRERAYCYAMSGGVVKPCITEEYDISERAWEIEKLCLRIIESEQELFGIEDGKYKSVKFLQTNPLGRQILIALKFDFQSMAIHFPCHEFNAHIELFRRHMVSMYLDEKLMLLPKSDQWKLADDLNAFVSAIRNEAKTLEFKKTLGKFRRLSNKNLASYKNYIDALFDTNEQLVVIRIDFGYKKATGWPNGIQSSITYTDVKEHQKKLLKFLRTKLPNKPMVGYAWSLEYALDKGWNQHLMIFLDCPSAQEGIELAQKIGNEWSTRITTGQGLSHICKANDQSYRSCGTGSINYHDTVSRKNLEKAAVFMTRPDYYFAIVLPNNGRAFGKGGAPKPRKAKELSPTKQETALLES